MRNSREKDYLFQMKISKRDFIPIILLPIVLFFNAFMTQLPLPSCAGYLDEAFELTVAVLLFIKIITNKHIGINKYDKRVIWCILLTILVGLFGNVLFWYANSAEAIFRDIVQYMKFPITYLAVKYLRIGYDCADFCKKRFSGFVKFATVALFLFGVASLITDIGMSQDEIRHRIRPYQFLFGHPTNLVLCSIFLLAMLEYETIFVRKSSFIYELMLVGTVILSMRTKGFVIVAAYLFIKYAGNWMRRFKILYWVGITVVIFAAAYSKLNLVFSYSASGRMSLYTGSIELMKKCFPIGSGFATWASHLSGKYYSLVYDIIDVPEIFDGGNPTAVLGDTGYPYYIGQFGVVGIILFIVMMYSIYRSFSKDNLAAVLLIIYILVALTTETVLANNGVELGIILATVTTMTWKAETSDNKRAKYLPANFLQI